MRLPSPPPGVMGPGPQARASAGEAARHVGITGTHPPSPWASLKAGAQVCVCGERGLG